MVRRKRKPLSRPARLVVPLQPVHPHEADLGPDDNLAILFLFWPAGVGKGIPVPGSHWISGPKTARQVKELREEFARSLNELEGNLPRVSGKAKREELCHKLRDEVLDLLTHGGPLGAKQIAGAAGLGRKCNTWFRGQLALMVKLGLLTKVVGRGYQRTLSGP